MAVETVVLVHGLWMNGLELSMLGHRLRHEHGFEVCSFSYPTLHGSAAEACTRLAEFASGASADPARVHFVAHSLGGVIVHRLLSESGRRFAGNSVVLGSPLNGSRAARGAARWAMLRPLLGPLVLTEVATPTARTWSGPAALGSIAGTLRMGTGQFFARFDEDNDGTVAVSETAIPGLADHLVLPHSHIGMLYARDVASYVAHFLRNGRFTRPLQANGSLENAARRPTLSSSDP
jgi:pimeloyl-ACP methyl ester carboxylesterase